MPLHKSVVGPSARFEELGPWTPYLQTRDEMREAHLWLNDSRKREKAVGMRVVGRRRYRTGKVA